MCTHLDFVGGRESWHRKCTLRYNNFFGTRSGCRATVSTQTPQIDRKEIAMKNRNEGSAPAAWPSQEPQRVPLTSGPRRWGGRGGTAGYLFPRPAVLPAPAPSDYTPRFCASRLAGRRGGRASRMRFVVLFPSLPCRQYSAVLKEGLGSLLFSQAFFFAHEKMKKKKKRKKNTTRSLFGSVWPSRGLTVM